MPKYSKKLSFRDISSELFKCYQLGEPVILVGKHGVGKSSIIHEVLTKDCNIEKESILYLNGSTIDPYTNFIGIPHVFEYEDSGVKYLDSVRPRGLTDNSGVKPIRAIILDEFNRAEKPARNALMELIQFKSIGGVPFKHVEVVWAAMNPEDDDEFSYDVETIDVATKDRFFITLRVPYKCNLDIFIQKYGDLGKAAVEWWENLSLKDRYKISPRRLDYVIKAYLNNVNLYCSIDEPSINVNSLLEVLKEGSRLEKIKKAIKENDIEFINKINWNEYEDAFIKWTKTGNINTNHNKKEEFKLVFNSMEGDIKDRLYYKEKELISKIYPEYKPDKFNKDLNKDLNKGITDELILKDKTITLKFLPPINSHEGKEIILSRNFSKASDQLRNIAESITLNRYLEKDIQGFTTNHFNTFKRILLYESELTEDNKLNRNKPQNKISIILEYLYNLLIIKDKEDTFTEKELFLINEIFSTLSYSSSCLKDHLRNLKQVIQKIDDETIKKQIKNSVYINELYSLLEKAKVIIIETEEKTQKSI